MSDTVARRAVLNTHDPHAGYSIVSLILHWVTAAGVIVLFFTHEDDAISFHISLGLVLAPVFLFRIWWRFSRGYPRVADQSPILNVFARLIQLAFMLCLVVVAVSGLLLPGLENGRYPFFELGGFYLQLPPNPDLADFLEDAHELAGDAFVPLVILHVVGALKHHFLDRDNILLRMMKPVRRGR